MIILDIGVDVLSLVVHLRTSKHIHEEKERASKRSYVIRRSCGFK